MTLPNTPDNLRRWLRDPQEVKPENLMPTLPLTAASWTQTRRLPGGIEVSTVSAEPLEEAPAAPGTRGIVVLAHHHRPQAHRRSFTSRPSLVFFLVAAGFAMLMRTQL